MKRIVCTSCGYVGFSRTITKGSILIELILWLCLLIPGIIYSIWRHTTRYQACSSCLQSTIIPADSPMGKKFIVDHYQGKPPVEGDGTRAFEAGRAFAKSLRLGR